MKNITQHSGAHDDGHMTITVRLFWLLYFWSLFNGFLLGYAVFG